jgi:integrase
VGRPTIRVRRSKQGVLFYLDYTYKGTRHRPPLGYDLTIEQQNEKASEAVKRIHTGNVPAQAGGPTFKAFLPTYWQAFTAKGRVDTVRPQGIIDNHLLPRFGDKPLTAINDPAVGMDYITARLKDVTAGTVQREWNVLMRIINLAVRLDKLDRNRLSPIRTEVLPEPAKRERTVHRWELEALRDEGGNADVWRMAVAAMHTGLRESKLFTEGFDVRRQKLEEDGYWLHLDKSSTSLKGNPELVPLNRWAREALSQPLRWTDIEAFKKAWATACDKAKIADLHFHDLRHLFATALEDLDVQDRLISILMGHAVDGMTGRYIRKNLRRLREAVTKLEGAYNPSQLTVSGEIRRIA